MVKVLFRTDASTRIGTGHVMRCLTLARALREKGAECAFVGREHPGNVFDLLGKEDFTTHRLPVPHKLVETNENSNTPRTDYAAWLGVTSEQDASDCLAVIGRSQPDWLVVDHYALDATWEKVLKPHVSKIMVIDDLADRVHRCDVLLDQNLGRSPEDYIGRVPSHCQMMIGPHYVLLRDEFSKFRGKSLQRRQSGQLRRILVSLGGADQGNITSVVIAALEASSLPDATIIDIVVGGACPHCEVIIEQSSQSRFETSVSVNVSDMAMRMADADLAIGAAGGTTWERFCMGLPALLISLAKNQEQFLEPLMESGAIRFTEVSNLKEEIEFFCKEVHQFPEKLIEMSEKAALLIDGKGVGRVVNMVLGRKNE